MTNKDELLQDMRNNALVITPNNRLSAQLLNDFAAKYLNQHAQSKPSCLPYQKFLQYLFKKVQHKYPRVNHPLLLSQSQERYLWRNIIHAHANAHPNIQNSLQEAWNRCRTWQIPIDAPEFQITNQYQLSQNLQKKYQQELQRQNLLSSAMAVNYIIQYLHLTQEKIIWACFDDYTPAQRLLQDYLAKHNNQIIHFDLQTPHAKTWQYIAKDLTDEYQTMLAWLQTRITANDKNIAIVVPNIAEQSQNIVRLLQKDLPDVKINISLGENLDKFLIVKHALSWLTITEKYISQSSARLLLNSPFIGGSHTEFTQRAELAENSKLLCKHKVNLHALHKECTQHAPILATILAKFSAYPDTATPKTWATIFTKRLAEFSFPGEYPLTSQSYQCLQRLQEVLQEFKKLALFTKIMDKKQALTTLHDLIQHTIFQPQTTAAQINILGLLEASGCTFDSIWVCNLTDKCLPSKTNFSAFIPLELQVKLLMPHATNERELQFAKQQLRRLRSSCANIIFSYPRFIADTPMLGSPLLQTIEVLPKNLYDSGSIPRKREKIQLSTYTDSYVLPVKNPSMLKGGTSILATQAKCPFMAFAKHRLTANSKEDIYDWPSNLERGQMLHKALEIIWQRIKTSTKLRAMQQDDIRPLSKPSCIGKLRGDSERRTGVYTQVHEDSSTESTKQVAYADGFGKRSIEYLCLEVATEVLGTEFEDAADKLSIVIKNGEIQRLRKLMAAALAFDLNRPDFKINAIEKSFTYKLGRLEFTLRVDRIDELITQEQEQIIIDYKSSIPSAKPWQEERPLEPQLLLYALLNPKISCIMYLQLKNGKVTASGIAANELNIGGVQIIKEDKDWQEHKNTWQAQLLSLANEFTNGICHAQPAKPNICQSCDFQDLCRVTTVIQQSKFDEKNSAIPANTRCSSISTSC